MKGNYELKIRYDVKNGRALKELTMSNGFKNVEEMLETLLDDITKAGPMLDQYIPPREKAPEIPNGVNDASV